jgi:hypothetical protein
MSDILSGRSGIFAFLLALLILIISVVIKYVTVVSITPANVHGELDEVFDRVAHVTPLQVLKAEFLMEWGEYRNSDECSEAVSTSRLFSGNGFEGDVYVVSYPDSIEFPGIMTLRRQFRVEKPMRRNG